MTLKVPNLRPLGMGRLLDQAINLLRRKFLLCISVNALVQIPLILLHLWLTTRVAPPPSMPYGAPAGLEGMEEPGREGELGDDLDIYYFLLLPLR